ncbi:MAG TPA: 4-alpha-glucanotransferase [Steroidobacteraceae bacterium]|jgi:4-alpha-glucanotransferase
MTSLDRRRSGVLLHPTSLPQAQSHGALGASARRFVDLIADAGFTVWQMLPIGPVDASGSPYLSRSVHAGSAELIDLEDLATHGWLRAEPGPGAGEPAAHFRARKLLEALIGFENQAGASVRQDFESFLAAHRQWLLDDGLFLALKAQHQGRPWWQWAPELRDREPRAIADAQTRHAPAVDQFVFEQYLFHSQWQALRAHARNRGVLLFGDIPIYVAHDSVEVWAHRAFFQLDSAGQPVAIAGVPPDYFSAEGQVWGNPLYDWSALQRDGFAWWVARLATQLERFDLLRIDHFRGLESYWAIPGGAKTGKDGEWRPAPGAKLLERLATAFGKLPVVAEDLGVITPEVERLRDGFDLPGMRILQFAFDGSATNPYLPHNHVRNCVVYTGTHDNDTTRGWSDALDANTRRHVADYFGVAGDALPRALMRSALGSVARLAVVPLQDLLGLDSRARMNTPATTRGNWTWTFSWEQLPAGFSAEWRHMNLLYGRA